MKYLKENRVRIFLYTLSYFYILSVVISKGLSEVFSFPVSIIAFGIFWYETEVYGLKKRIKYLEDSITLHHGSTTNEKPTSE